MGGSIALVVERAGKFSKLAYAYNMEQEKKHCAINRFLALGGKYQKYSSHKEAYPVFVDDTCAIFDSNSRAVIFGGTVGSAHEHDDQSGTKGQPASSTSPNQAA